MDTEELIADRAKESEQRTSALRQDLAESLSAVEDRFEDPQLCIYATGSLARREATIHSDLDAFFLLSGSRKDKAIGRIRDVKILNAVVRAADKHEFPDFSNEGEFLKFLHIDDLIGELGSREDDYHNTFTARMLMILESKYLYNEEVYRRFQHGIINAYFRDFHDHAQNFKPVFLLNDILRFWRTLCINYEHARHWREDTAERAAKGHLGNLKLRFSRLCICYSFIAHLLAQGASLSAQNAILTAALTPMERLAELRTADPLLIEKVGLLREKYAWFLEHVGRDKQIVLDWIAERDQRDAAFEESRIFVRTMGEVVRHVAEKNGYLRFLIV